MKVFLGGTCNGSKWRDELIPLLKIDYFNPVVPDWTPECMDEEIRQREECDICLYGISAKMTGVYSIAELVDDSNKRPEKTVMFLIEDDDGVEFTEHQFSSMSMVCRLVAENGAKVYNTRGCIAEYLNSKVE